MPAQLPERGSAVALSPPIGLRHAVGVADVVVARWPLPWRILPHRSWRRFRSWSLLAVHEPQQVELDPAVVRRAQDLDPHAFAQIVRFHEPRLRPLAYRLLGDRDRTDDILQEAYVKAFRALGRFRGESSLSTWLYRITYNACMDELRRQRTVTPASPDDSPERPSALPDPADTAVERGDLAAALAALPAEQRAVVLLVDADGLDYSEAGEVLGIPPGTVGSRLSRARAALRAALGVEG